MRRLIILAEVALGLLFGKLHERKSNAHFLLFLHH